jgi:hypothetical protein
MPSMRRVACLVVLVFSLSGAAQAQTQIQAFLRPDCRDLVSTTGLHFDTPEHVLWYRRFWTGDCSHLTFCLPGSPNWNDIVGKLLARGGPVERAALLPKACRLGQLIGLDWSRDRKVRHIDTGDLRKFKVTLDASGDALRGVNQVEALAQSKIGR